MFIESTQMTSTYFYPAATIRGAERKHLGLQIAVLAASLALAGCSSQPETADIQKDLAEAYACPILELSDVKKVEGASSGKFYDVAFTHTMSIKGGADTAAKLFAEWSHLAGQQLPAKMALEQAQATGNVAAITQAEQVLNAMDTRLVQIMPCETLEAVTRLQIMRTRADEAIKTGQPVAPVAVKIRGQGRMAKAESGWHFAGMPAFSTVEIVMATAAYPRFAAPSTPIAAVDTVPAEAAGTSAVTQSVEAIAPAGPSFDCNKASTAVEKMICASPALAAADAQTVAAYTVKLSASSDPEGIKQHQATWRRTVRDACTTPECVTMAYQQRLVELK